MRNIDGVPKIGTKLTPPQARVLNHEILNRGGGSTEFTKKVQGIIGNITAAGARARVRRIKDGSQPLTEDSLGILATALERSPDELLELLGKAPAGGCIPAFPSIYIGRENDDEAIRSMLSPGATVAAVGLPGMGKTTLSMRFCHDAILREKFPSGVLWASLGERPSLSAILIKWALSVGVTLGGSDPVELSEQLKNHINLFEMLVVIDDVWNSEDAGVLHVGNPYCTMLMTTRSPAVAESITVPDNIHELLPLDEKASCSLFQKHCPSLQVDKNDRVRGVLLRLGGLPIGIIVLARLINDYAKKHVPIEELLADLEGSVMLLQENAPPDYRGSSPNETLTGVLDRSTKYLESAQRRRFAQLGAFESKPFTFDINAVKAAWNIDYPQEFLSELVDRGLIESAPDQRYQIHHLIRMHALNILRSYDRRAFDSI